MKKFFILLLFIFQIGFAGSLRLVNDSSYDLRVIIRGNGGDILGTLDVLAGQKVDWDENYLPDEQLQDKSQLRPMNRFQQGYTQTPYTVTWLIADSGEPYSSCNYVSSGSYVSAKGCQKYGKRPEPKEKKQ
jgi:hypothetical protein